MGHRLEYVRETETCTRTCTYSLRTLRNTHTMELVCTIGNQAWGRLPAVQCGLFSPELVSYIYISSILGRVQRSVNRRLADPEQGGQLLECLPRRVPLGDHLALPGVQLDRATERLPNRARLFDPGLSASHYQLTLELGHTTDDDEQEPTVCRRGIGPAVGPRLRNCPPARPIA